MANEEKEIAEYMKVVFMPLPDEDGLSKLGDWKMSEIAKLRDHYAKTAIDVMIKYNSVRKGKNFWLKVKKYFGNQ